MSGDVEVVYADWLSRAFQCGADAGIVIGDLGSVGQYRQAAAEIFADIEIAGRELAFPGTEYQFRESDR
jgi:hypothetical protein